MAERRTHLIDLVGHKFGRLTVLRRSDRREKTALWDCVCECGAQTTVRSNALRSGRILSCGCLRDERISALNARHLDRSSAEYRAWCSMLRRCRNPNVRNFRSYGGRGISVCAQWLTYESFLQDMGRKPTPDHSIDRIDVNGNYEPSNCRWATREQQGRNRRDNHLLTAFGGTMCLEDWSARTGLPRQTIGTRLALGWSAERALSERPQGTATSAFGKGRANG